MKSFWKDCTLATATASLLVGGGMLTADRANALTLGAGQTYIQDFNTLNSGLPTGWVIDEVGTNEDDLYGADHGTLGTGNTYSYGATGGTERALGSLGSGGLQSRFGVKFDIVAGLGGTGTTELLISYYAEQWRQGRKGEGQTDDEKLDFQYSTNATSLATGTWTDFNALDLTKVDPYLTGGSGVATDGNVKRNPITATITGLNLNPGATIWLRWVDSNSSGDDFGLAVDDFSITAIPTPSLLPGLVALGLSVVRKRRSSQTSAS